ncbi:MAG: DUF72 domain-containing protein, partial [Polyangiales bacterium]
MRIVVGTSGYGHAEWRGGFYPDHLTDAHLLGYYALRFRAVEIGRTFYSLPDADTVSHWAHATPKDFVFSFKAPRSLTRVTHVDEVGDGIAALEESLRELEGKHGPVLLSCPSRFRRDGELLHKLLSGVCPRTRAAVDLGDASALPDETRELLERHGAAVCVTDTEGEGGTPLVSTAPFGYVRLCRGKYSDDALEAWAERIADQGWDEAFVIVAPEDKTRAPDLALRMLEAVEAVAPVTRTPSKVPPPKPLPTAPKPLARTKGRTKKR